MNSDNALLFLHAQTPLHPGSGTALGVVDLPVQRERHTQWPIIPGSSLKGILRWNCVEKKLDEKDIFTVFGPDTANSDAHAGALSITDARILAYPVRSLKGVFAWVTCPAVLERLSRDLNLAGNGNTSFDIKPVTSGHALCAKDSPLVVEKCVILEEYDFTVSNDCEVIAEWISGKAIKDQLTRERLKKHLVVLHDDDFTHFVRHATEICARIGLDYETKTVKKGALFYEEFLPSETLFYSVVMASASRNKARKMNEREVLGFIKDNLPPVIQIGGDETIGKGFCVTSLYSSSEGGA